MTTLNFLPHLLQRQALINKFTTGKLYISKWKWKYIKWLYKGLSLEFNFWPKYFLQFSIHLQKTQQFQI